MQQKRQFFSIYENLVLKHPVFWLFFLLATSVLAVTQLSNFRLDASADALVLEHDKALERYREVVKQYGGSEFLVITYTPKNRPLFQRDTLEHLDKMHHELQQIEGVQSVYSMLDVPLLFSPPTTFSELAKNYKTLRDPDVDLALAKQEFIQESPIYEELLVSKDGNTTAVLVTFSPDDLHRTMVERRTELSKKQLEGAISATEKEELAQLRRDVSDYNEERQQRSAKRVAEFRAIIKANSDKADLFLGGVPMIATDMVSFVKNDLQTFGVGILLFIIVVLFIIFRQPRWVIASIIACTLSALWLTAILAFLDWKVTVISSNYLSLLLIITMSISIYLITRYREFQQSNPDATPKWLVREATRHMIQPSFFMVTTTMVGFASLVVSDIRPVIDFGWMMTIGISLALIVCYLFIPSMLLLIPNSKKLPSDNVLTEKITLTLASFTERRHKPLLVVMAILLVVSFLGVRTLTVENRFIDYFKDDTEIHQGMLLIDKKLGGTTPLDIIIDAPKQTAQQQEADDPFADDFADPFADDFDDPFADLSEEATPGKKLDLENAYWYTPQRLQKVTEIQQWLSSLPETGKVLSLASTYETAVKLNGGPLSYLQLMLMASFIPADLHGQLVGPYLSDDGNQLRISLRVVDSDPNLKRNEFLQQLEKDLIEKFDFEPEQVTLTGALVLYNNMLQSLFDSQIKTLGLVFAALFLMLLMQLRSVVVALITLAPSISSAFIVLGTMGWIGLPLDLMTITVAAISVGIAVDDSIHYVHRFTEELSRDNNYIATMRRCHRSTGRAMYFTSITIIAGFSILVLSNFNPTIYFGLLTGTAMLIALFCNLTVLPALLLTVKPKLHLHATAREIDSQREASQSSAS
ncbi:MAG TPA: MMPL family transporter [Alcanivoracaceae bacterium]|nr:MMPL family transporter [Alcanivoracaceae bacterium]